MDADAVRARAKPGVVLPRFLRRPVRALRRIEWRLPRHFGVKAIVALFIGTAVAGVVVGGNGVDMLSAATAWAGFAIENVKITGQSETSEVDVLSALDIGTYPSLLTLDLEAARARIEALPWVKTAALKKLYPDTVEIAVSERDPYATWQHDNVVSLVDRAGKVITDDVSDQYAALPRVVGIGAAEKAADYAALLAPYPAIAAEAKAGILVSESRWTIVLKNGIELMLPSDNPQAALATIVAADRDHGLLSREITAVDLRQPGQMIVRLTQAGIDARAAELKARDKASHGRTNT
ncbi:MAG: FtsQ-type POTRA domain-containing protein [Bauldia sp.]